MSNNNSRWIVGISGASGMKYSLRLIEILSQKISELHVVFSEAALRVLAEEEGKKLSFSKLSGEALFDRAVPNIYFYNPRDIGAAIASGSYRTDGMVVCPCSMASLAAIATGLSQNLLQRAADVTLKENRRLILVPRETPLSAIHLENMLSLAKLGVSICPAMPGFYHQPKTIDDLVDMQVTKILDLMKIDSKLIQRWGETKKVEDIPDNVRRLPTRTTKSVIELSREV